MALNVKFLKGTAAQYAAATKDANTFYYTTDDGKVYLGTLELTTEANVKSDISALKTLTSDKDKGNQALYNAIQSMTGGQGSIAEQINNALKALIGDSQVTGGTDGEIDSTDGTINGAIKELKEAIKANADDIDNLETLVGNTTMTTTAQTVTGAINELNTAISNTATNAAVTISKDTTVSGVAARYTISQGGTALATTIDIPKDMVVESGEVVDLTEAQAQAINSNYHAGQYIKLIIANKSNSELYIPANALVDEYTAAQNATQVQVAINNRVVSATIVAGSITATELANNAVETAKIKDGAVIKAKLDSTLQDSINAADNALQASDIKIGSAQGKISVKGTDVAVNGLKSAAYTESSAYATAAQGVKADSAVQSVVEGANNGQIKVDGTAVNVHGLGTAAYTAATAYDAAGSAATAESNANTYTDNALTWGTIA